MIIINGRFLLHRITGVERFARELLNELDKTLNPGEVIMAIPPETQEIPRYKNIEVVKVGKLSNRMWEHISFPIYVSRKKAISLNLCNVAPILSPGIVVIHDLKIKAHPEFHSKSFLLWYRLLFFNEVKRAKKLITVSEFSKLEMERYYHVKSEEIDVVPDAWQHMERVNYDEEALKKYKLNKGQYFFAMSSMDPNKNFKWIAEQARLDPQSTFAIAGSINKRVFNDGMGFDVPDNMKLLGYVSDEEAKTLMRDCKAFLFPSIYEGFGMPPLEAMASGCKKIIVSDIPVMHEIFGNYVSYIDAKEDSADYNQTNPLYKYSWKKSASLLRGSITLVKKSESSY